MTTLTLKFKLRSAATFGRGEGLPGLLDQEVEHDTYGLPYLRGRALRGLLAEEMENLVFVLQQVRPDQDEKWRRARDRMLGKSGAFFDETGIMHVGDAQLPQNLRLLLVASVQEHKRRDSRMVTGETVLESLTAIRRQTAMTPEGAPDAGSLRALRVILWETPFEAILTFDVESDEADKALLTATVLAWRRAGMGRNRGRGWLCAWLESEEFTKEYFKVFNEMVLQEEVPKQ